MESAEHLHASRWAEASAAAGQAITLFPDYVESDSPYLTLSAAHAGNNAPELQFAVLQDYWRKGGYAPGPMRTLATELHQRGRTAEAVAVLRAQNYITPFSRDLHEQLGDWLLETGEPRDALTEFEVALALKPHDLAAAHFRVARAHHALGQLAQARGHLLSALEIAPHYRPAQKLLGDIYKQGSE
jgi:tetratricopeptide (TPR) repeat protein